PYRVTAAPTASRTPATAAAGSGYALTQHDRVLGVTGVEAVRAAAVELLVELGVPEHLAQLHLESLVNHDQMVAALHSGAGSVAGQVVLDGLLTDRKVRLAMRAQLTDVVDDPQTVELNTMDLAEYSMAFSGTDSTATNHLNHSHSATLSGGAGDLTGGAGYGRSFSPGKGRSTARITNVNPGRIVMRERLPHRRHTAQVTWRLTARAENVNQLGAWSPDERDRVLRVRDGVAFVSPQWPVAEATETATVPGTLTVASFPTATVSERFLPPHDSAGPGEHEGEPEQQDRGHHENPVRLADALMEAVDALLGEHASSVRDSLWTLHLPGTTLPGTLDTMLAPRSLHAMNDALLGPGLGLHTMSSGAGHLKRVQLVIRLNRDPQSHGARFTGLLTPGAVSRYTQSNTHQELGVSRTRASGHQVTGLLSGGSAAYSRSSNTSRSLTDGRFSRRHDGHTVSDVLATFQLHGELEITLQQTVQVSRSAATLSGDLARQTAQAVQLPQGGTHRVRVRLREEIAVPLSELKGLLPRPLAQPAVGLLSPEQAAARLPAARRYAITSGDLGGKALGVQLNTAAARELFDRVVAELRRFGAEPGDLARRGQFSLDTLYRFFDANVLARHVLRNGLNDDPAPLGPDLRAVGGPFTDTTGVLSLSILPAGQARSLGWRPGTSERSDYGSQNNTLTAGTGQGQGTSLGASHAHPMGSANAGAAFSTATGRTTTSSGWAMNLVEGAAQNTLWRTHDFTDAYVVLRVEGANERGFLHLDGKTLTAVFHVSDLLSVRYSPEAALLGLGGLPRAAIRTPSGWYVPPRTATGWGDDLLLDLRRAQRAPELDEGLLWQVTAGPADAVVAYGESLPRERFEELYIRPELDGDPATAGHAVLWEGPGSDGIVRITTKRPAARPGPSVALEETAPIQHLFDAGAESGHDGGHHSDLTDDAASHTTTVPVAHGETVTLIEVEPEKPHEGTLHLVGDEAEGSGFHDEILESVRNLFPEPESQAQPPTGFAETPRRFPLGTFGSMIAFDGVRFDGADQPGTARTGTIADLVVSLLPERRPTWLADAVRDEVTRLLEGLSPREFARRLLDGGLTLRDPNAARPYTVRLTLTEVARDRATVLDAQYRPHGERSIGLQEAGSSRSTGVSVSTGNTRSLSGGETATAAVLASGGLVLSPKVSVGAKSTRTEGRGRTDLVYSNPSLGLGGQLTHFSFADAKFTVVTTAPGDAGVALSAIGSLLAAFPSELVSLAATAPAVAWQAELPRDAADSALDRFTRQARRFFVVPQQVGDLGTFREQLFSAYLDARSGTPLHEYLHGRMGELNVMSDLTRLFGGETGLPPVRMTNGDVLLISLRARLRAVRQAGDASAVPLVRNTRRLGMQGANTSVGSGRSTGVGLSLGTGSGVLPTASVKGSPLSLSASTASGSGSAANVSAGLWETVRFNGESVPFVLTVRLNASSRLLGHPGRLHSGDISVVVRVPAEQAADFRDALDQVIRDEERAARREQNVRGGQQRSAPGTQGPSTAVEETPAPAPPAELSTPAGPVGVFSPVGLSGADEVRDHLVTALREAERQTGIPTWDHAELAGLSGFLDTHFHPESLTYQMAELFSAEGASHMLTRQLGDNTQEVISFELRAERVPATASGTRIAPVSGLRLRNVGFDHWPTGMRDTTGSESYSATLGLSSSLSVSLATVASPGYTPGFSMSRTDGRQHSDTYYTYKVHGYARAGAEENESVLHTYRVRFRPSVAVHRVTPRGPLDKAEKLVLDSWQKLNGASERTGVTRRTVDANVLTGEAQWLVPVWDQPQVEHTLSEDDRTGNAQTTGAQTENAQAADTQTADARTRSAQQRQNVPYALTQRDRVIGVQGLRQVRQNVSQALAELGVPEPVAALHAQTIVTRDQLVAALHSESEAFPTQLVLDGLLTDRKIRLVLRAEVDSVRRSHAGALGLDTFDLDEHSAGFNGTQSVTTSGFFRNHSNTVGLSGGSGAEQGGGSVTYSATDSRSTSTTRGMNINPGRYIVRSGVPHSVHTGRISWSVTAVAEDLNQAGTWSRRERTNEPVVVDEGVTFLSPRPTASAATTATASAAGTTGVPARFPARAFPLTAVTERLLPVDTAAGRLSQQVMRGLNGLLDQHARGARDAMWTLETPGASLTGTLDIMMSPGSLVAMVDAMRGPGVVLHPLSSGGPGFRRHLQIVLRLNRAQDSEAVSTGETVEGTVSRYVQSNARTEPGRGRTKGRSVQAGATASESALSYTRSRSTAQSTSGSAWTRRHDGFTVSGPLAGYLVDSELEITLQETVRVSQTAATLSLGAARPVAGLAQPHTGGMYTVTVPLREELLVPVSELAGQPRTAPPLPLARPVLDLHSAALGYRIAAAELARKAAVVQLNPEAVRQLFDSLVERMRASRGDAGDLAGRGRHSLDALRKLINPSVLARHLVQHGLSTDPDDLWADLQTVDRVGADALGRLRIAIVPAKVGPALAARPGTSERSDYGSQNNNLSGTESRGNAVGADANPAHPLDSHAGGTAGGGASFSQSTGVTTSTSGWAMTRVEGAAMDTYWNVRGLADAYVLVELDTEKVLGRFRWRGAAFRAAFHVSDLLSVSLSPQGTLLGLGGVRTDAIRTPSGWYVPPRTATDWSDPLLLELHRVQQVPETEDAQVWHVTAGADGMVTAHGRTMTRDQFEDRYVRPELTRDTATAGHFLTWGEPGEHGLATVTAAAPEAGAGSVLGEGNEAGSSARSVGSAPPQTSEVPEASTTSSTSEVPEASEISEAPEGSGMSEVTETPQTSSAVSEASAVSETTAALGNPVVGSPVHDPAHETWEELSIDLHQARTLRADGLRPQEVAADGDCLVNAVLSTYYASGLVAERLAPGLDAATVREALAEQLAAELHGDASELWYTILAPLQEQYRSAEHIAPGSFPHMIQEFVRRRFDEEPDPETREALRAALLSALDDEEWETWREVARGSGVTAAIVQQVRTPGSYDNVGGDLVPALLHLKYGINLGILHVGGDRWHWTADHGVRIQLVRVLLDGRVEHYQATAAVPPTPVTGPATDSGRTTAATAVQETAAATVEETTAATVPETTDATIPETAS
ncbi:hypothetical protein ACFU99_21515, partial [Streptomyces sp. NPDC057654]